MILSATVRVPYTSGYTCMTQPSVIRTHSKHLAVNSNPFSLLEALQAAQRPCEFWAAAIRAGLQALDGQLRSAADYL